MGRSILSRDFSEERIKDSYARIARFYNFWSRLTGSKAAQKAIEFAQIRDGEKILEVAVGTGLVFEEIVKRNRSGSTEGIDLSPAMLSRAEKRLRNYDKDSFHLQLANAYHLPFETGTFDLIINNYMFDLIPEQDFIAVLSEFNRVLKPSGRIVISTMSFGRRWYNKIWHWITRWLPSLLTGCRPVSLFDYLIQSGFSNIQTEYLSQNMFPSEVIRADRVKDNKPEE